MERNGSVYCNACCLSIQKQKHEKIGLPNEEEHYHNRWVGDCWDRLVRRLPPDPPRSQLKLMLRQ